MRDTTRYPVTTKEALTVLKAVREKNSFENTGLIGDMTPLILSNIEDFLKSEKEAFEKFLQGRY